jgi:mannose-6-phosphate isomerase-like protein (cupin superfamily)
MIIIFSIVKIDFLPDKRYNFIHIIIIIIIYVVNRNQEEIMITRKSDLHTENPANVKGGAGSPTMTHFMSDETSQGIGRLFAEVELNPGVSIGYHQHLGEQEVYYVISGVATVEDDDKQEHELGVGDSMICFDGESHSVANNTDEPLKLIALVTYTGLSKSS